MDSENMHPRVYTALLQIVFLLSSSQIVQRVYMMSQEECWRSYPFTYSKCSKICSSQFNDFTCLDDQLCYCNMGKMRMYGNQRFQVRDGNGNNAAYLNWFFGTNGRATCHISDFCDELCKNDESLLSEFPSGPIKGALCKFSTVSYGFPEEVESCVCSA